MDPGLDWEAILSIIGSIAAVGVAWGYSRGKAEETERRIQSLEKDIWREVSKLRDWRHDHETESANKRVQIEQKFSELAVKLADTNGKFQAILERLDDVLARITNLERK